MNSFPYPLNKFGTLTTVLAHIAFLGTVPFQALYPLPASTNPTESQTITASHIPISLTNPPNTQSREGDLLNAATDVHLASSNDLTVTAAIQTNTVDAGGTGHIVSRRHVSDEHLARGTFISTSQHKAVGDHAFHWGTTTPEAVPALLSPTESATEASSTAAPPSPERTGQTMFTDLPGGIIAASTIILTLVIVLARRRPSPAADEPTGTRQAFE